MGNSLGLAELLPAGTRIVKPTPNKEGKFNFPDGEIYLRLPHLKDVGNITIVHSGYPNPNDGLIELYMMLDIIRGHKNALGKIHIVFASFPYARQDNSYYDGELNAARELLRTLIDKGASSFSVIDAHFAGESWTRSLPIENVSMTENLMQYAQLSHPGIVFMTPDAGSRRRTRIKSGTTKTRTNSFEVEVKSDDMFRDQVSGKIVAVVDDLLSTGMTLQRFLTEAKRSGAKKVAALVTHGVNPAGIELTKSTFDGGLFMTNTIDRPEANIDATQTVWGLIQKDVLHAH